jgi:hypothetical protein
VAHLQRKIEAFNHTHWVQKREDSPDRDQCPTKKRGPSKGDDSSYEPSPINEVKSFDLPRFPNHPPLIEGGSSAWTRVSRPIHSAPSGPTHNRNQPTRAQP